MKGGNLSKIFSNISNVFNRTAPRVVQNSETAAQSKQIHVPRQYDKPVEINIGNGGKAEVSNKPDFIEIQTEGPTTIRIPHSSQTKQALETSHGKFNGEFVNPIAAEPKMTPVTEHIKPTTLEDWGTTARDVSSIMDASAKVGGAIVGAGVIGYKAFEQNSKREDSEFHRQTNISSNETDIMS